MNTLVLFFFHVLPLQASCWANSTVLWGTIPMLFTWITNVIYYFFQPQRHRINGVWLRPTVHNSQNSGAFPCTMKACFNINQMPCEARLLSSQSPGLCMKRDRKSKEMRRWRHFLSARDSSRLNIASGFWRLCSIPYFSLKTKQEFTLSPGALFYFQLHDPFLFVPQFTVRATVCRLFWCIILPNSSFSHEDIALCCCHDWVSSCFARWTEALPSCSSSLFWSKAAGRTRYPFSLRNQLVQTNTSPAVHLPTIITSDLPHICLCAK